MNSIIEAVSHWARVAPNREAARFSHRSLTYEELCSGAASVCLALRCAGFLPGDKIILPASKTPEFLWHYLGSHAAGLTNIVVDPKLQQESLRFIVDQAGPVASFSLPHPPSGIANYPWYETTEGACIDEFPDGSRIADLMFTTGTTGQPKGVLLSHRNLLAAAQNINTFIGNQEGDREILALPICHSFGLGRVRCQLLNGGSVIFLQNFGNEKKLLQTLKESGAEGFSFVPAAWAYLSQLCGERFFEAAQHLKYIEIGSASLPQEEKMRLMEHLPHTRLCMHYGLTEASRSTFIEFHSEADHLKSIGRPSPHVEVAVLTSHGQLCCANAEGEICVRGSHVMTGYLGSETPAPFLDGFFRTGDLGSIDHDGYIYLTGRIKELINTGGKKVSPWEVEKCLDTFPGIKESGCRAAQDPDGILGEVVEAFIVMEHPDLPTPSLASIRRFLAGKLEDYKLPRLLHRIDSIPRTESGKVQRLKL